jgi:hypothetical protein
MAVVTNPTVAEIIIQGMSEAGQYSVTTAQSAYLSFKANQWETIKAEIWNACRTDRMLEGLACRVVPAGLSDITEPDDFDSEIKVELFWCADEYRGTAQAGTSTTITLASDFSTEEDDIKGRRIFITDGAGENAQRLISAYNNTTKVLTVSEAWPTSTGNPNSTSEYVIGMQSEVLPRRDYDYVSKPLGRPRQYSRRNWQIELAPAADENYPILLPYRQNLTLMDEADSVFIAHLRRRRHLWIQGVKVKTMAKFDDDRRAAEEQIWERMLAQYGAQSVVYTQMEGYR